MSFGPPEMKTREAGLPGLKDIYGIEFQEFRSLDAGGPLTKNALKNGDIDVARMFTTQGAIGENGWISPEDHRLYHHARTPEEGVEHILRFYSQYHSSRYVDDQLVIRMQAELSDEGLAALNDEFHDLVRTGAIERCSALDVETEHLEQPRIIFHHTRNHFGRVRSLIDRLNDFAPAAGT